MVHTQTDAIFCRLTNQMWVGDNFQSDTINLSLCMILNDFKYNIERSLAIAVIMVFVFTF